VIDDLYSTRILALAAETPHAGRLAAPQGTSERVAKLCGSKVRVDIALEGGRVSAFAQDVRACALGQAAASVLGANIIGAEVQEIIVARDALSAMLRSGGPPPVGRFSELAVLNVVKDYPSRYASTLLAFEAAAAAATEAAASGSMAVAASRTSPAATG
jgi:NifU-like protein involved in Fe-S cluster formation